MKPSRAHSGRPPAPTRRRLTRWLIAAVGAATVAAGVYVAVPASAVTSTWIAVSSGTSHTCAIKTDTTLWCWGSNDRGQLGLGHFNDSSTPAAVQDTGTGWSVISTGGSFSCGIRNGYRYCWGANDHGQLGLGAVGDRNLPRRRSGEAANWATLDAGVAHVCGVRTNTIGQCWGMNTYGALGLGHQEVRKTPFTVAGGHAWQSITAGAYHSCGLDTGGTRYCWGTNETFELGLNLDSRIRLEPTSEPTDGFWVGVDAGAFTSCGLSMSRRLYCWGTNTHGQAGVGNTVPVDGQQLVSSSSWQMVSSGGGHACAVRSTGTLYCWGHNGSGELGLSHTTDEWTETLLPTQTPTWSTVSAGAKHTCGIRADATLWCWGYNLRGQLGIGTTTSASTPVLVQ